MGTVRYDANGANSGTAAFTPWDAVDYLIDESAIQTLVDVAIEEGDPVVIASVMRDVVRARTVNQLTEATGLDRSLVCGFFSGVLTPTPEEVNVIARVVAAH